MLQLKRLCPEWLSALVHRVTPMLKHAGTTPVDGRSRRTAFVLTLFAFVFVGLQIASFTQKSATWDESIHLTAGYSALALGDYRIDPTHPPFLRMWAALPLLAMGVGIETSEIDRTPVGEWLPRAYGFAHEFLYRNNDADRLLYAARGIVLIWAVVLGILLFYWTREWLGFTPAVLMLLFYTIAPNLGAHSQLVTTDLAVTCFIVGTIYCLWLACWHPTWRNISGTAVFFALAQVSKFSGVLLVPVVIALLATALIFRMGIGLKMAGRLLLLMGAAAFLMIWACYGFHYAPSQSETWLLHSQDFPEVRQHAPRLASAIGWIDAHHLLPNAFSQGFLLSMGMSNLSAYLGGDVSADGWWYYFPAAFALKAPSGMILLFFAGVTLYFCRQSRRIRINLGFAMIPILIFTAFAMASRINIGIRHILPIIPFVLLVVAFASKELLAWKPPIGRLAFIGLVASWIGMFAVVYPNTLAFFNLFAGGPDNGLTYLADSNLDWGQDLKMLKSWMERNGVSHINLAYFGTADPDYYQIPNTPLPGGPFFVTESIAKPELPGYVAISATVMSGVYLTPQWRLFYSGFQREKPVANIGYSIRVFWVEHWPESDMNPRAVVDKQNHRWLADELLFGLNWPEHAAVHYRSILRDGFDDPVTMGNLGVALFQGGKGDQAVDVLQQASDLEPNNVEARRRLVVALLKTGKFDQARLQAEAAVRLRPTGVEEQDILGLALSAVGDFDAARAAFLQALKLAPDYTIANDHLRALSSFVSNQKGPQAEQSTKSGL